MKTLYISPLITVRELRYSFLDIDPEEDQRDRDDHYRDYKNEAVRELNSR